MLGLIGFCATVFTAGIGSCRIKGR